MTQLTNYRGVNQPLMFREVLYQSIATADVDPLATAEASRTPAQKGMIDRGFCIRGNASGAYNLYGITWNAYYQNGKSLTGLTPVLLLATGASWELTPLIKVYAEDDGTYPTTCSAVNIGLL